MVSYGACVLLCLICALPGIVLFVFFVLEHFWPSLQPVGKFEPESLKKDYVPTQPAKLFATIDDEEREETADKLRVERLGGEFQFPDNACLMCGKQVERNVSHCNDCFDLVFRENFRVTDY